MTRTVLVTGGAGFVGSHLIERILDETDWRVVSVDSFRGGGTFFNLLEACDWDRERVTSITHDLTIPLTTHAMRLLDERYEVDAIVNVASRSHVRESIVDPTAFVANNVQLMLNVLELAVALDVDRFVQMSTDEVYGPNDDVSSATDYRPSSPYAASKATQETLCHAWQRTYDLPLTVINSANMIGERQRETAFLPLVVDHLQRDAVVPIHAVDGRLGRRHYSYVGNVVDELVRELRRAAPSGRVQLGGQRTLTNLELVEEVAVVMGVQPKWQLFEATVGRPGYDPFYPTLDDDWTPRVPFGRALERTVRWYLDA